MRVIWEAADIQPGLRVRKPGCNETWMIGFDAALHGEQTPAFAVVSLIDGMICVKGQSAEQLVTFFNSSGDQPVRLVGEAA